MKPDYFLSANVTGLSEDLTENGELWFKVSPYGDFPNKAYDPRTKLRVATIQRFDRASAEKMKEGFDSMLNQVRHMFRGLAIYEGHADDPQLLTKPGHTMSAVGRVKELDVRDDGLWARGVMNTQGIPLVKGEAAPYSATSPFWWTVDSGKMEGNARITTPVRLESIALTNKPNISDNFIGLNQGSQSGDPTAAAETTKNRTMKSIREKLGLPEDASDDEVLAAIAKLQTENAALKREKGEVKAELEEANTAKEAAEARLETHQRGRVDAELNQAIEEGKITEAQKPKFAAALNSDFEIGKALLDDLKPQAELNTENKVGKVDKGKATQKAELNTAMAAHAEKNGLDLTRQDHFDRCYDAVREDVYGDKE